MNATAIQLASGRFQPGIPSSTPDVIKICGFLKVVWTFHRRRPPNSFSPEHTTWGDVVVEGSLQLMYILSLFLHKAVSQPQVSNRICNIYIPAWKIASSFLPACKTEWQPVPPTRLWLSKEAVGGLSTKQTWEESHPRGLFFLPLEKALTFLQPRNGLNFPKDPADFSFQLPKRIIVHCSRLKLLAE